MTPASWRASAAPPTCTALRRRPRTDGLPGGAADSTTANCGTPRRHLRSRPDQFEWGTCRQPGARRAHPQPRQPLPLPRPPRCHAILRKNGKKFAGGFSPLTCAFTYCKARRGGSIAGQLWMTRPPSRRRLPWWVLEANGSCPTVGAATNPHQARTTRSQSSTGFGGEQVEAHRLCVGQWNQPEEGADP